MINKSVGYDKEIRCIMNVFYEQFKKCYDKKYILIN